MSEWIRNNTPTIMDGLVVRWQRGRQEISASRNAVYANFSCSSEADFKETLRVLDEARQQAAQLASEDRFGRFQWAEPEGQ